MDNAAGTTTNTNHVIFTYDLSGRSSDTGLRFMFDFTHHNEASDTDDRVRIRGSNTGSRIQIYDWYANRPSNGVWKNSGWLDIDSTLAANGQSPSSTFQIRFGQRGAAVAPTDGFSMDNLIIEGSSLTTYYKDNDNDGYSD